MGKLRLLAWLLATSGSAWWLGSGLAWPPTPEAQAMTVVRGVAGALALYLFVVSVLAIRVPRLAPRFVRRLVAGAVGTALLTAPMAGAASADERPAPAAEAPVLRRVTEPEPAPPIAFSAAPPPDVAGRPAENATTVEPGDHLWGIAEAQVAAELGRQPTDAEVVPYWHELLRANDGRLRSGDPNLVFPGEHVVLPS